MKNIKNDLILFAIIALIYCAGRLAIFFLYPEPGAEITFNWLLMAARFDMMTAAYFLLPTAVFTIIGLFAGREFLKFKRVYADIAIIASFVMAVVNVCYFFEYKSQFNFWIFGIFYDDAKAIGNTIFEQYPVFTLAFAAAAFSVAAVFLVKKAFGSGGNSQKLSLKYSAPAAAAYIFILFFLIRGARLAGRPLQLRDTAATPSAFMNNLIPTSAYCLKTEISKFLAEKFSGGLKNFNAKEKDLPWFARSVFGRDDDIDAALTRKAKGAKIERPPRIFVLICESHSGWPLIANLPQYDVIPNTRALSKNALFARRGLPAGSGTMATVSSIISGLPYTEVSVKGVSKKTADFAFARQMKNLGYSSVFYYGGQSTWLGLGDFAYFNKFDNVVGGEQMGDVYGTVEWGVRDKDLFAHILKADIPENTASVILTVSNHQPYDVDLAAEGCPEKIENDLENKIWHEWYTDKCVGDFVREIQKKYPDSLFVITGDHSSRYKPEEVLNSADTRHAVPIIFCGKPVEKIAAEVDFAEHLDIFPTLVEMIAPEGFEYKAWGESLLDGKRKIQPLYTRAAVSDGKIVELDSNDCPSELREFARKFHALAYWRSLRSDGKIPPQKKK